MEFTYTILKINQPSRAIKVQYSKEGLSTHIKNLILPHSAGLEEKEELSKYLVSLAPIKEWSAELDRTQISMSEVLVPIKASKEEEVYTPPSLGDSKKINEKYINALATQVRHRFISPNKDATYSNKSAELDKYLADGSPETAEGIYPYIEAEAAATGQTIPEVAQSISTSRAAWFYLDPIIESIARAAKVAIQNATSTLQINDIVEDAKVQFEGI